jgi:hypothetical protein
VQIVDGFELAQRLGLGFVEVLFVDDLPVVDEVGLGGDFQPDDYKDEYYIDLGLELLVHLDVCEDFGEELGGDLGEEDGEEVEVGVYLHDDVDADDRVCLLDLRAQRQQVILGRLGYQEGEALHNRVLHAVHDEIFIYFRDKSRKVLEITLVDKDVDVQLCKPLFRQLQKRTFLEDLHSKRQLFLHPILLEYGMKFYWKYWINLLVKQ